MKLESAKHYYNLVKKTLNQKGFRIEDLEIATDRVFSYYEHEKYLCSLGYKSPTLTMYLLIKECDDINDIVKIIIDFIKMAPEIALIIKDYESAISNHDLELVSKYLSDEYFETRRIKWREIYNYDNKFVRYVDSLCGISGVYFVFNKKEELIFIGKSKDLSSNIFTCISDKLKYEPYYLSVFKTNTTSDANILKPFFVSKFNPIANTDSTEKEITNLEISIDNKKLNYLSILKLDKIKIFLEKEEE